ncbi:MAG TPA: DUF1501 domain-containing protein [Planctomycetota bacterium]|nr:DUF1501 domain-containing protein [Planctomycetota bacterium]
MRCPRENAPSRREVLKLLAAGVSGTSLSGWLGTLAAQAKAAQGKKCILLWMDGGPSQTETFDPKPDADAEIRGGLEAIKTSVPGILIGEKFPRLARLMHHAAVLRGMKTLEADHGRARISMHTGFRPGAGGVDYPGLGSIVAAEIGRPDSALPNFVVTGSPLNKYDVVRDPGYRGPSYQPLVLRVPGKGLEKALPPVPPEEFDGRVKLLESLDARFRTSTDAPAARAHEAGLAGALKLLRSDRSKAFDLTLEPPASAAPYGESDFGRGCLLARRLAEAGVAFVEVYLSNWDSHEKNVAEGTRDLMTQVDQGASALIGDLADRGMLQDTLIIWMGEFGRTPRTNRVGGRDHYAQGWTTVLFGGGVRGGQVIGSTDRQGVEVTDRAISAADFMGTVCRLLGIDYAKEIDTPGGRPVRIVEKGERLIQELF